MRSEDSAREKVLEKSFFCGEGRGPEIGDMDSDDGVSGDPAASADVARQARVKCFVQPSNAARRVETVWMSFWPFLLRKRFFFCVGFTCAVIKTSFSKRVETQTSDVGETNTRRIERRWFVCRFC